MKRSWLIAGAVAGILSGAAVGACGSSTGSGGAGASGVTSSVTSGKTTATGATTTTGNPTTSVTTGNGGAGGAACKPPGTLHPPKADAGANTLYCPFSGVDGGPNISCDPANDHCCEPTMGTGTCDPTATACGATDMDWTCEDPVADCPGSTPVCCAVGASIGLGAPGCANFAHTMHSTTCVATGACTNGIIMCTDSSECPAATPTCTPFGKAGNQVGGCM